MTCTLKDKSLNSSELYVTYDKYEVSNTEMTVIDTSSVRLSKHMNSMEHVGNIYFACMYRRGDNAKIVVYTYVTVDYLPSPIKNFSCIIYNWDEGMICTWNLGVKYNNTKTISVSLLLKSGDITGQYKSACDRDQNNNLICNHKWNHTDHVTFDRSFLNFTVNVTNTCCTEVPVSKQTENLIIIQKENVRPDKVHNVTVSSVTSTCISLNWDHLKRDRSKLFTVRATTNDSNWDEAQVEETPATNITVCELKPYKRYNFSIETRPGKDVGYPSDLVYISAITDIDINTDIDSKYGRYNFSIETRPGKDVGYPSDLVYISVNTDIDINTDIDSKYGRYNFSIETRPGKDVGYPSDLVYISVNTDIDISRYNFSIETRPGKDVGYPSDLVYISAITDIDKPSGAPEFVNKGYQLIDEDCINNARRITLLWKAIDEEYRNGPFIGYYISASSPNDVLLKDYQVNSTSSDNQQHSMDIPCDQPITITIKALGKAGYSNTSTIIIPKANYLSQSEIAGIVIGVVTFVVIFITLVVCLVRMNCCGKIKEIFKSPEIVLPKVKIHYMEHNKDSGHETDSKSTFKSTHANSISEKDSQYSAVYSNAGYSSVGSQNEDHFLQKGSGKDGSSQSICESFSDINSSEDTPQSSGCSYESYSSGRMLLNSEEDDDGYRGQEEDDSSVKSYVQQDGENSSEITSSNTTETSSKQSTAKDSQQDSSLTTHQKDTVKTAIKTSEEAAMIKSTQNTECV
ncbi:uncharacterized protein LOC134718657 [Mytilus trossulus]|uniref:uncharacterized protein LOC134718657 n=1 Tax=Mytilus trossulus TaxID=6551 RepID=UPI003006BA03